MTSANRRANQPIAKGIASANTPAMREAIVWLVKSKIYFRRQTQWQLKIGDLSYYPDKCTIYRDGDQKALSVLGLDALRQLLRGGSERHDNPQVVELITIADPPGS